MTLDATVAGASANSYLSVADADAFAASDIGQATTAWAAASTDLKERSLKRATREIDTYLRSSGLARYSAVQLLLYPRAVDVLNGTAIVPKPIQLATWAQAKFLNANADVLDATETRRASGYTSESVGSVSYSESINPAAEPRICDEALGYLQGVFARGATVRSVLIGTDYTYPVLGDPGLDVLP